MQHEHELITGTALRMKDSFVGRYLKDWWTLNIEKTWNGLREDECHLHQKQIFTARLALTKKVLRSNLYQTIKLVVILLDIQVFSTLMKILSLSLSWTKPRNESDGFKKIIGYVIEYEDPTTGGRLMTTQ
ncbi:uncharacterized protein LOC133205550 isoform X2 [Saccostrea echinata]|uniref:uncharacterized protein LOC133205550 isoform X2 n=1 Tax=Saccostrea echinata TaxID=191078 RepID=UPI002A83C3AF|nr:uncharacterized protein LOC133205550 isoform X2 [Saccostrea echinata]XP_061197374.1 uncharacterized protein LOC133205550 isoform X2 [Saccostrea echinata]